MVPPAKRPRKDPACRRPPAPRNPLKRKAESPLPVHKDFGALEDVTDVRKCVSTQTNSNDANRASRYLGTVKRLRTQVAYQRSKCGGLLRQLAVQEDKMKAYNDDRHYAAVKRIVADSQTRDKKAVFLRHQIEVYGSKRPSYSEELVRECVIWRFVSPKGYDHARKSDLLTLPAKCTLQRYVGPSPTSSGMSPAMKERLIFEASMLSRKQHMASLIIDEAAIKPKCVYDRKADTVFGLKDKPDNSAACSSTDTLANIVLCFVLHGVANSYRIPCAYYFTKQLSGRGMFAWTKEVICAVESCGFVIVRVVTDNYSANVTMFKHMGNGCLSTAVPHPHDSDKVIFLSFDPCHILKNVRSQFLERELTDGAGVITGKFVQKLYEFQKDKTVKLARNLTRKHVYPSNLEKMNVLRAIQTFSLQVTASLSHLQENRRGDPALYSFREVTPTHDDEAMVLHEDDEVLLHEDDEAMVLYP
uniref:p-20 hm n=1 Tax=Rhipicephalus zambeziensis TaxID=60191 RepID=A0A224YVA8_9ACAR